MAHEAGRKILASSKAWMFELVWAHFVILSSMLRGSRIKVGRTTLLRSAPGRSCEIIWVKTAFSVNKLFIILATLRFGSSSSLLRLGVTHHCPDRALRPVYHRRYRGLALRRLRTEYLQVAQTSLLAL